MILHVKTVLSKTSQKITNYIDDDDQVLGRQIIKSSFWHRHQRIRVQMHPTIAHGPFPESEKPNINLRAISAEDTNFLNVNETFESV